jgi:hypothetical protein
MKSGLFSLSLLLMVVLSASCSKVLKLYYGVHKPMLESEKRVAKYASRKGIDHAMILIPKSAESFLVINHFLKTIPDLFVYNEFGKRIQYASKENCNAPAFNFTDSICISKFQLLDSLPSLDSIYSHLRPLDSEDSIAFLGSINKKAKFNCLISWTKYSGVLNKDHVRPWVDSLNAQTDCTVQTYLINLDFIEGIWTIESLKKYGFIK